MAKWEKHSIPYKPETNWVFLKNNYADEETV